MAYTSTLLSDAVAGNLRMRIFSVSSDGVSGNLNTGLNKVDAVSVTFKSCTTAGFAVLRNKSATGTVANGYVAFASAAATDTFEIICFGG